MKSSLITTTRAWVAGLVLLTCSLFFYACKKDVSAENGNIPPGKAKLSVFLTDGPTDYQKVLIDIQSIAVKLDTCHRNHDDDHFIADVLSANYPRSCAPAAIISPFVSYG